jgi:hypothetical protein
VRQNGKRFEDPGHVFAQVEVFRVEEVTLHALWQKMRALFFYSLLNAKNVFVSFYYD